MCAVGKISVGLRFLPRFAPLCSRSKTVMRNLLRGTALAECVAGKTQKVLLWQKRGR